MKGSVVNLSWSLSDMKYRRTRLLYSKPMNWMIWGVNEKFQWVLRRLPFEVFIYVVRSLGAPSGLALYGTALEPIELAEKYWPQGEGWKAFCMEVKAAALGVLENPESPEHWKLISQDELRKRGIKILPGPQKLIEADAATLKTLLSVAT